MCDTKRRREHSFPGGDLEVGRPAILLPWIADDPAVAGADANSLLSHIVFSRGGRSHAREVFSRREASNCKDGISSRGGRAQIRGRAKTALGIWPMKSAKEILMDLVAIPSVSHMSNRPIVDYSLQYLPSKH